jgi:hypothetical protein
MACFSDRPQSDREHLPPRNGEGVPAESTGAESHNGPQKKQIPREGPAISWPRKVGYWIKEQLSRPAITNWLLVILTAAYVSVSYHMWREMQSTSELVKESANAATKSAEVAANNLKLTKEAAELARQAFDTSERAWVFASIGSLGIVT